MKLTSSYITTQVSPRGTLTYSEPTDDKERLSAEPPLAFPSEKVSQTSHLLETFSNSPGSDPPTVSPLDPPRPRLTVPGHDPGTVVATAVGGAEVTNHGTLFFDEFWAAKDEPEPTCESYSNYGIPSPESYPASFQQEWQSRLGLTPQQYFQGLFDTPRVRLGNSSIQVERDHQGLRSLDVEMDLHCPRTNRPIGHMDRQFHFSQQGTTAVYHRLFELFPGTQGKGIAKDLLANSVALYEQAGVSKIDLYASLEVGGYAWAKYGFSPKPGSQTRELFRTVAGRLQALKNIPPRTRALVEKLLASEDPKAIWALSDLEGVKVQQGGKSVSLGKALLLGTSWQGSLDLQDPQARARFDQYISRPS